jgi:hypothetical protein
MPVSFFGEIKRRIIKSLFTIAFSIVGNELLNYKNDNLRLNALKIALKMMTVAKYKEK